MKPTSMFAMREEWSRFLSRETKVCNHCDVLIPSHIIACSVLLHKPQPLVRTPSLYDTNYAKADVAIPPRNFVF